MVFCLTEQFWTADVFDEADNINVDEAETAIMEQALKLNPSANLQKLQRFIFG